MTVKVCARCGTPKPKTGFYYSRDDEAFDGWYPVCKECRKQTRRKKKSKEVAKKNQEIAKNVAVIRNKLVNQIIAGKHKAALCNLSDAGEELLNAFGGLQNFMAAWADDYNNAPAGTAGKAKLLLGAAQFLLKTIEDRQPIDVGTLDDNTLRAALKEALGEDYDRITETSEDGETLEVPLEGGDPGGSERAGPEAGGDAEAL